VHKYEKLEKIYYRKRFIKFLVIILVLFLFFLLIKIILNNFINNQPKKFVNKEINFSKKIIFKQKINKEKNISNIIKNNKSNDKTRKNIVKKKKEENNLTNIPMLSFTLPKLEINNTKNNKIENNKIKVKLKNEKKTKNHPLIIEENIDINTLIKNFEKNPSFDLAIQISEYYLNKNKLDIAKLWALKANNIDPSRYESWKIFAIILIKKNQKDKAIEILKVYLKDYGDNENIKKLLRSLNE
jgi:predicted Zn-dependent protease